MSTPNQFINPQTTPHNPQTKSPLRQSPAHRNLIPALLAVPSFFITP